MHGAIVVGGEGRQTLFSAADPPVLLYASEDRVRTPADHNQHGSVFMIESLEGGERRLHD